MQIYYLDIGEGNSAILVSILFVFCPNRISSVSSDMSTQSSTSKISTTSTSLAAAAPKKVGERL